MWAVGALLGLTALIAAAWVVSNWSDAPPAARPAALSLPTSQVADERNAFFSMTGVFALSERQPHDAGRAQWARSLEHATRLAAARGDPAQLAAAMPPSTEATLQRPSGAPYLCETGNGHCSDEWLAQPEALAVQLGTHRVLSERCRAIAGSDLAFEELMPPLEGAAASIAAAPHLGAVHTCGTLLDAHAVVAFTQGRRDEALQTLMAADRLNRALVAGNHTLIAQMVAASGMRRTLHVMAALGARDAALARSLAPVASAPLDMKAAARRWMVAEAHLGRGMMSEASLDCRITPTPDDEGSLFDRLTEGLCRHRIGWHPHRTAAAMDAQWLAGLDALDAGGLPAALAHAEWTRRQRERDGVLDSLAWRNTMGQAVIAGGGFAYGGYLARQLDVELHRETVALMLRGQAAAVPRAQRPAWIAAQPLAPLTRDRIAWNEAAGTLSARPWSLGIPAGYDDKRARIEIAWRDPPR